MRVLYSFPHRIGSPGIGTTAAGELRGLAASGADVTLYCASLGCDLPGISRVVETLAVRGRRVRHRLLGVDRAYRYHDWRVARAVAAGEPTVDVVHAWPAACRLTLAAAKRAGVASFREVVSAHTASAYERAGHEAAALGLELPAGHSHRFDARRLAQEEAEYDLADVLLVPSAYAEQTFLDRGFSPDRLARHQYGYDPAKFAPSQDARAEDGSRPFTAVFVGRGEPNKGLHYALEAWADARVGGGAETGNRRRPGGRFLICGEILDSYRRRIAPLLDDPSIELLGYVADVGAVMRNADVLVLPTVTEGSALVTYEAQGCGCVLLVSDAAGAVATHMVGALVHRAGDTAALTEHLRMVSADRDLLGRLRAATIAGRDRLTWERAGARLVDIYASTAAHPA